MDSVARRTMVVVAAGSLSLLTGASMVASPSLAGNGETEAAIPAKPFLWTTASLSDLRKELAASAGEGLDPAAYDDRGLSQTVQRHGESLATDRAATQAALAIARDYARGRVDKRANFDWHIETAALDMTRLESELAAAVRDNRLRPWLRSLLPGDKRYALLRAAYAVTPESDTESRDRLRANLERWRWMPRALGPDHIYVNVPSYRLDVIEDGRTVSVYTVVVGKRATPTPAIAAEASSIVVNPWWNVPPSIQRTMRGTKGYTIKAGGRLAQPPGPRNALGKVKIDMPNPHHIYLHDTPSKSLFAQASRAYSHGCIRVKEIDRLASELARLDQGNDATVLSALEKSTTKVMPLQHRRPVYLVYFTAEVGADGRLVRLEDPYGRDARLIASLDAAPKLALAPSKTAPLGTPRKAA